MCASSSLSGVNAPDLGTNLRYGVDVFAHSRRLVSTFVVLFRAVLKTAAAALVSTRINNVFVAELALYLLLGLA